MSSPRAPITQKLVNEYPLWSAVRTDEQSNGAQFLNTLGNQLQDLHEQLKHAEFNYTIPFANLSELDQIYKFILPKTYNFALTNNNESNPIYAIPTVTGIKDNTNYSITLSDNNDIESFWYNAIPTRISTFSHSVTNIVPDSASANMYGVIASITQDQSPYTSNIVLDEPQTRLWVQCIGGTKYLSIDDKGLLQRASIIITGITRQDILKSETLIFLHDDIQPTKTEWKSISKIEIFNIEPSSVIVRVYAHQFGRTQTPQLFPPKDFYNLASSEESKQDMDTFYDIGSNTAGNNTLQVKTWELDDIRIRLNGFVGLDVIRSFELRDMSNAAITTAKDIAIQPFSNNVWIVDNTKLYLFDNKLSLPNMSTLNTKVIGAMSIMKPNTYHITPGDSVDIEYYWQRQISEVARHRTWVMFPDGSLHSALAGSFSSYNANAWVTNNNTQRYLRGTETYTLSTAGDYNFYLETVYANGVKEIDQRIISADTKKASAEFSFSSIVPGGILSGIDFDSDNNMWILVNTSNVYTKLKVILSYDTMMIDYQNKIIYLRDQYDQIKVT
jgi:hypothetical protein